MLAFSPHLIGGWGYLHASSCPRAFYLYKLESRNPIDITEALIFKFLFIFKDINLAGSFFSWKFLIYVYSKQLGFEIGYNYNIGRK